MNGLVKANLQELEHEEQEMNAGFARAAGALRRIRDKHLYLATHNTFEEYCQQRLGKTLRRANQLIAGAEVSNNLRTMVPELLRQSIPERHIRELVTLEPELQREVYKQAIDSAPNGKVTAAHIRDTAAQVKQRTDVLPDVATRGLFIPSASQIAELRVTSQSTFNSQDNDSIEWAKWTWNPVTGCLHGCDFCYARDIANYRFPQKFAPTFLPERLAAPRNTHVPKDANSDISYRNVFVCSMADLWGKWVPTEIIEYVLQEVRANQQWNFLFLTKFPARYEEFAGKLPRNCWMGTTVVEQANVERAEKAFTKLVKAGHEGVRWLSVEPMFERITFNQPDLFHWFVTGGASKSSQTPAFVPPSEWVAHLHDQVQKVGGAFYMKTNIRFREYPSS